MNFKTFLVSLLVSAAVFAGDIEFKDPKGDDHGPGGYVYPTDGVYSPGSFDLTKLSVRESGSKIKFSASVNAKLDDPWGMGGGFATQMIFIFIDTTPSAGHAKGLPGLNVNFGENDAWDKVVILSPQKRSRVISEAKIKAANVLGDIIVPSVTKGKGKTISGSVKAADLGGGDPASWGYQVLVQSNEGFPAKSDLLTRKVNEFEGQHRFGGGNDGDCDPHVMDLLAGKGEGSASEVKGQHDMLAHTCDAGSEKQALLKMIRK